MAKGEQVSEMTEPRRIQRKRTKGWRMPPNTVYVGRGSKWGNPHRADDYKGLCPTELGRSYMAVKAWREDLADDKLDYTYADIRRELKGKNLACWCGFSTRCHGDDMLKIANNFYPYFT